MKVFIEKFERDCRILNDFLLMLKDNGLNPEIGAKAREHLERLPLKSRMRILLLAWLTSHLALHERMGLGCVPLLVSSDIIETIMGKIKQVIERMPAPEFTTLTLATPLFCGRQSHEKIQTAIDRCSHKTLTD